MLGSRLRTIRVELYGGDSVTHLAADLGVPERTWDNYERGVVIPGDVLLRFLAVTGANPLWLLGGDGPRYLGRGVEMRDGYEGASPGPADHQATGPVL